MTARRKKAAKKKAARKKGARRRALEADVKRYTAQIEKSLKRIEQEVDKAERRYRKSLATLLRDANRQVGRLDTVGDKRWRDLIGPARRDFQKLLKRMEKAVAPGAKRKKAAAKKKRAVKKKAVKKKAVKKKAARRKARA
ncbi:MAG: hypothetical protein JRG96_02405 [Deltaproteobacteria bacterium]|nr:hypothetical protein [Deltaproteobacteria bacterium]